MFFSVHYIYMIYPVGFSFFKSKTYRHFYIFVHLFTEDARIFTTKVIWWCLKTLFVFLFNLGITMQVKNTGCHFNHCPLSWIKILPVSFKTLGLALSFPPSCSKNNNKKGLYLSELLYILIQNEFWKNLLFFYTFISIFVLFCLIYIPLNVQIINLKNAFNFNIPHSIPMGQIMQLDLKRIKEDNFVCVCAHVRACLCLFVCSESKLLKT